METVVSSVKDAVMLDISAGKFKRTGRLPGFRELAERYHCSRGTIENAVRSLADEGLVFTTRGRGTFLANPSKKKIPKSRIAGAILLRCSWLEAMEELRGKYLEYGWFVSTYCASDDLQDPVNEARFLLFASQQHFAAVILVGSPKKPLNTELYRKLRREGMKVLHLAPYQLDMSREIGILPDYEAAGGLAVSKAAVAGYRKIYYVRPDRQGPSSLLRRQGVFKMAQGLELSLKELPEKKILSEKLPGDGIFLIDSADAALKLRKQGRQEPVMLLTGSREEAGTFDRISFDFKESIRLAMEYVMDETISPAAPFRNTLAPKYYPGTL